MTKEEAAEIIAQRVHDAMNQACHPLSQKDVEFVVMSVLNWIMKEFVLNFPEPVNQTVKLWALRHPEEDPAWAQIDKNVNQLKEQNQPEN